MSVWICQTLWDTKMNRTNSVPLPGVTPVGKMGSNQRITCVCVCALNTDRGWEGKVTQPGRETGRETAQEALSWDFPRESGRYTWGRYPGKRQAAEGLPRHKEERVALWQKGAPAVREMRGHSAWPRTWWALWEGGLERQVSERSWKVRWKILIFIQRAPRKGV